MTPGAQLLPEKLPAEPLEVVARWLDEAFAAGRQPNPNSMVLATINAYGGPSARVVLCKEIRAQPGYVTFFTNYLSRKGRELADNPRAAAVMHWDALGRQVRLEGTVTPTSAADSDAYFGSRPWQSRLGAWASAQSEPIRSHAQLVAAFERAAQRFGTPSPVLDAAAAPSPAAPSAGAATAAAAAADVVIPRPPYWGGYHLWVDAVELWVAGPARLHDRARWQRPLVRCESGFEAGPWSSTRLQP
ncbi:MAG: pyridoxine/pyridoxamine 5'-phosphate oxidase [Steroidobacteraceae bacterium]